MFATRIIPYKGVIAIIFSTLTMGPADAAIGYDCETQLKNKTISLDIHYCDLPIAIEANTSTENIALLQLNEFGNAIVLQCKIEIRRSIYNCGGQSNNTREYIYPISSKACEIAHDHGTVKIGDMIIDGLRLDATTTRNITLAGSVDSKGACIGGNYSDPYGTWNNVVVTATVKITLHRGFGEVNVDNDTIYLSSGHQCKWSKEQCITDGGYIFWPPFCSRITYSILYKGNATKLSNEKTVYSVIVDGTRFSLITVGTDDSCHVSLLKTDSPKLFIVGSNDLKRLEELDVIGPHTLDIFQYENDESILVERLSGLRYPVRYLHRNVIENKCYRENLALKNMLPIAFTNPDAFAFEYIGGPGYTAVIDEDSINIAQCVPVEVKLEQTDKCYNRMPILRGNQRLFLTPKSHIITSNATELPCESPTVQTSQDANGNITNVSDRVESAYIQWLDRCNKFTVSILCLVCFGILVYIYITYCHSWFRFTFRKRRFHFSRSKMTRNSLELAS